jgi:hypothetical protein
MSRGIRSGHPSVALSRMQRFMPLKMVLGWGPLPGAGPVQKRTDAVYGHFYDCSRWDKEIFLLGMTSE